MSSHTFEDLTSSILDFQAHFIRVIFRKKTSLVDPDQDLKHKAALDYIWSTAKMQQSQDESGEMYKWRKLGFDTEDVLEEFRDVGVLGLECMVCVKLSFANIQQFFLTCNNQKDKIYSK